MNAEPRPIGIIRLHKRWADGYTPISQVLILLLSGGAYILSQHTGLGAPERIGAFILFTAIILATVFWQAVRLGIVRAPMIMRGIDLVSAATSANRPSGRSQ